MEKPESSDDMSNNVVLPPAPSTVSNNANVANQNQPGITEIEHPAEPTGKVGFNKRVIFDFVLGFALIAILLIVHANATLTQFWGIVSDIEVALMASLALSVVLLISFALFIIWSFVVLKKPFIAIGSVVGFPIVYALSQAVREGFTVFFNFI
ncbi:MAG: hypothetical protein KJ601_02100 [Nanoarchaeota archaeon]|nr:hypothetical protein [Nanoarchaeota archaeon]MBU1704767.1 hypothetical protein [Nanoarchaeota archaeon]